MFPKNFSGNPEAFFTHCFGHALNLAVVDMVKNIRLLTDSMETTYEISNLIKKCSKRDAMLQEIQNDILLEYPGFRVHCPIRWTVRAQSIKSTLVNWVTLQQTLGESLDEHFCNRKLRVELMV